MAEVTMPMWATGKASHNGNEEFVELVTPIYETERDFRDTALAEAERFMEDNFGHDQAFPRWDAIRIDPSRIIKGSVADVDSVNKEFAISAFPDASYLVSQTEFEPQPSNNMAAWVGAVKDDADGRVQMTIAQGDSRTSLIIKLNTQRGKFLIIETELPAVYVVAQVDPVWSPRGLSD